jgi:vitamin B12 transporter
MRTHSRCIAYSLLLMFYPIANQAEDSARLPAITVNPTAYYSISEQFGAAANEFNRADLAATNKADLSGALRNLAGINTAQTGIGSTTGLILRGASGGLGLVNLDGVPLFNSFTGFFPLSHYPLDFFDVARVNRGLGGERNHSYTLGGSIDLTSRRMLDGETFLHSEGGSYGTLRNNLGGGLHNALGNFSVAAGRADIFEGISQSGPQTRASERDSFQMSNALLRWDRDIDHGKLDSSVYFMRTHEAYDGPGLDSRVARWMDDPNGSTVHETWVAQTHGTYQLSEHWESSLRLGFTHDQQQGLIGNIRGRRFPLDLTSQLWLSQWRNAHSIPISNPSMDKLRFIWGINAQQQYGYSPYNPVGIQALTNTLISPVTRLEMEWADWLGAAEVRFDHDDQFGEHTLFNLSAGRRLWSDMLLWGKAGTGYRAPAINERLHPLYGDTNLLPERNTGGEIGWRWQFDAGHEVSITGYLQRYDQLIVLRKDAATGATRSSNVPQADVWGIEFQTQYRWNDDWRSGLSYGFMDARNSQSGKQIAARPTHQGQFWSEWHLLEPLKLRVDMNYRDASWEDVRNTIRLHASVRLNANLSYQLNPKLQLYVRGENLNNDRTPDLADFNFPGAAVYAGAYLDW